MKLYNSLYDLPYNQLFNKILIYYLYRLYNFVYYINISILIDILDTL